METPGSKTVILAVASISSFVTPFMGSAVNIALPAIGHDFGMDALTLNWVSTAYLIASAVLLLPIGRAADIFGRKSIFCWGLAVLIAGSLLIAWPVNTGILLFWRVVQGIGSSMVFGTGTAILIDAYPPEERGRALGINIACTYLGLSLGPFIGGLLTGHLGWESVFLANVPIGLAALALAVRYIKEDSRKSDGAGIDLAGSFLYSLSLIVGMFGFSLIPASSGYLLALSGGAGLVFFVAWEQRAASPVLDVGLMTRNRQFAFSNLAAFIHYSATFAVTFLLSLYLQDVKGMSPQAAGLVLVSQPLVMMAFSPLAGRLSDRIEPRILASLGMGITCLGLLPLAFLGQDSGMGEILAPLLVMGLGFALFSSPNTNAIMSSVGRNTHGLASGMIATMRLTGQTCSMGIVLVLFAFFMGQSRIVPGVFPQFMESMKWGFLIFSFLCALGTAASLARGRSRAAASEGEPDAEKH